MSSHKRPTNGKTHGSEFFGVLGLQSRHTPLHNDFSPLQVAGYALSPSAMVKKFDQRPKMVRQMVKQPAKIAVLDKPLSHSLAIEHLENWPSRKFSRLKSQLKTSVEA